MTKNLGAADCQGQAVLDLVDSDIEFVCPECRGNSADSMRGTVYVECYSTDVVVTEDVQRVSPHYYDGGEQFVGESENPVFRCGWCGYELSFDGKDKVTSSAELFQWLLAHGAVTVILP